MTQRAGVGQFFAWDGGCLFIGRHDRELAVHAHQAMQLVVADSGSHLVRAGESAPWLSYSVAAIPSRQPHGLNVTASTYGAVIFIEPETREGRAITEQYLNGGIAEVGSAALREIANAMFAEWLAGRKDAVIARAREIVRTVAGGAEPTMATDARILKAIEYVGQHLDRAITLEEVASHACLSPSRFRHLFSEQTGMGLRPYVLWRRFLLVWDVLMKGRTLSEAAHAAGFADAPHLSRTSVRNFGFAPSAIQLLQSLQDSSLVSAQVPKAKQRS